MEKEVNKKTFEYKNGEEIDGRVNRFIDGIILKEHKGFILVKETSKGHYKVEVKITELKEKKL